MIAATHMVDRVSITQATVDRYRDRPFRWGACDCVRMAAAHLRAFGYKPQLAKGGGYRSANGARAALKRAGLSSIAGALDALDLERIPPASAWVGDIVQGEGDDALGALGICVGNGAMLGFHEDRAEAGILRMIDVGTAWRVLRV